MKYIIFILFTRTVGMCRCRFGNIPAAGQVLDDLNPLSEQEWTLPFSVLDQTKKVCGGVKVKYVQCFTDLLDHNLKDLSSIIL